MGSKTLGELCSFRRGASVPRARMYEQGDYLYVHYGDLYKGFELRIDVDAPPKPIPYITSDERIKESQWLDDQDIVYILTSETVDDLGHSFLFNNPSATPAVAGTETTVVRVERRDLLSPAYLNYLMHSPRFKLLLRQYVKGMKVFRVHPNDLSRIEIELPTLDKQRKIVSFLDAIFEQQMIASRTNDYLAEMSEAIVANSQRALGTLADICTQVGDKVPYIDADAGTYVSTESLVVDKGGRRVASSVPTTGKITTYRAGDTLVSNIRPYFKKVWHADCDGTCSADVIVFRALDEILAPYVYACLRQDSFFEFIMAGSKGTKMPRGDKKQMMRFPVNPHCDDVDLETISSAVQKMGANSRENQFLSEFRDALLPKLMAGEIDVSGIELPTPPNNHLCAD